MNFSLDQINAKRRARLSERKATEPGFADSLKRQMREYRLNNLEERKRKDRQYYLSHKGETRKNAKLWAEKNKERDLANHRASYYRHREKRNAAHKRYNAIHRERLRELERLRRLKNVESERERFRKHYQQNKFYYKLKCMKRAALQKGATVNLKSIREFVTRIKSQKTATCYYCQKVVSTRKIHFDHIIALSKGGPHSVENLCVSCAPCNFSKHDKSVGQFIRQGQTLLLL